MGEDFFRWRYCPVCKTDSPTTDELPPYAGVHDLVTGDRAQAPPVGPSAHVQPVQQGSHNATPATEVTSSSDAVTTGAGTDREGR